MKQKFYCKKSLKHKTRDSLKKIEMLSYHGGQNISAKAAKDLRLIKKIRIGSKV
ncbi:MAG TPA: hypothetical protein VJB34_06260 [Bdellovibrionota bacterium]|nr:hypothetical protein [Bdellovibrionota bacterium]HLD74484.1 hypothetical protein [Bdellovibrionota bacterium]